MSHLIFGQIENTRATSVNTNKALVDITAKIQALDNSKDERIEGSPFIYNDWLLGEITISSGSKFLNLLLKYDAFNEQLIYKNDSQDSLRINMNMIKEFVIYGVDTLRFYKMRLPVHIDTEFYQVVYTGKVELFKYFRKELLKFDSESSSLVESQPRLIIRERPYLIENDNTCELKKNKKKFVRCFQRHQKRLLAFINEQNINLKEDYGMKLVVQYYDTLIK